jgi:tungstate transport system ATP-binding protein
MTTLISLKNIRCRLSPNFSLSVAGIDLLAGKIYPLIGNNGSGKSTLLKLLALLLTPTEGTICFPAHADLHHLQLRRRITLVEQSPYLLTGTVRDNLCFGLKVRKTPHQQQQQLIEEGLNQVGLSGFAGRRAATLSSGEKQRVALARALVLKPELLLLDEPTANIDTSSVPLIEDLIRQLPSQGITVVCATHDKEQPQRFGGTLLRMNLGRLDVLDSITRHSDERQEGASY